MAGKKITELDQASTIVDTDLLVIVGDVSTIPTNKKVSVSQLTPDATPSTKGKLRIANDLGGNANNPTVTGIQSTPVSPDPPLHGYGYIYDAGTGRFEPKLIPLAVTDSFTKLIESPQVKSYVIDIKAPFSYTVNSISGQTVSGGISFTLRINGVNVGGLSSLNIGNASISTYLSSSGNVVPLNGKLELVIDSVSSPQDLAITIKITR